MIAGFLIVFSSLLWMQDPLKDPPEPDSSAALALEEFGAEDLPTGPGSFGFRSGNSMFLGGGLLPGTDPGDPDGLSDRLWTLDLANPDAGWSELALRLDEPVAFGTSVALGEGSALWIGGRTPSGTSRSSSLVRLGPEGPVFSPGPMLPRSITDPVGVLVGTLVYVQGGSMDGASSPSASVLLVHDLENPSTGWSLVPGIPRSGDRRLPVLSGHGGRLHVFGGVRTAGPGDEADPVPLEDAWRLDPAPAPGGTWTRLPDPPGPLHGAPVPALEVGASFIMIPGALDPSRPSSVRPLHAYHTVTRTWTTRGTFPPCIGPAVPVLEGAGSFLVPGVRPGGPDAPARVLEVTPLLEVTGFTTLDWVALGTYLLLLVLLGVHFARGERTTEDFFLGGRRVPWWAAGVSIFATQLSAITFMAIPAKSYASDWTLLVQSLGIFVMAPVVAYLFLPFFRGLNLTTAYEYLERRFSVGVRLFGSAQYLLFQFGRMAIVVYLPAIALSAVTGLDVSACILCMGVLCIVYTVLGGIEAVIWSDVVQAVVLLGGALLIFLTCASGLEGGLAELHGRAEAAGRLRLADLDWDFTRATLPVVVIGGIFINLVPYASDQSVVQRYLTTSDEASARKAIWLGGIISIPASLLFFGLGSALYAFYEANPDRIDPIAKTDQLVPWFLVNEVPAGLAGLVIAGIFAAAMSSLDSSMNSSATAIINDFYRRLRPATSPTDDARDLRLARLLTVVIGSLGTLCALALVYFPAESVFDLWLETVGLFASGLCGLFVLGIFTRRPGTPSALLGVVTSVLLLLIVKSATDLDPLLYAGLGTLSCFVAGWISSLFMPPARPDPGTSFVNRSRT
ncbi:MAG: sodium/solute symporter [Planctomycetota bacterium]|nr:sodium/solute symporter [Planctomycetota bacterium]